MLSKGLDLKLWWTSLQVLEIDATASKYLLLLPPWSLPLSSWGTKGKTGPWLHGQTSQPLAVTAAVAGVRDPLVCQELGLAGVLLSLLPTTLCDESQKTRQTDRKLWQTWKWATFLLLLRSQESQELEHRDHPANASPASEVGKSSW